MKPNKFQAIHALVGGGLSGPSDGTEMIYLDGQTPPTKSEIDTKFAELQTEYDAQEYARNRKEEYPDWDVQLDYIFHNGVEKWKTDIVQPIKDKYPKA